MAAARSVVLVCGVLACSSPTDHTQHLEIEAHLDAPLCAGNLARYETMVAMHEERLGRDLHTPVELELWPEFEWFEREYELCGPHRRGGCYARAAHHIDAEFDDRAIAHSLVHAIARNRSADDRLFVEGTAEALSGPTTFPEIAPTLGVNTDDISHPSAGHFVRWLWETRGPECTRTLLWTDASEVAEVFESACGSTFEAARDEFGATAPYYYPSPFECGEIDWVLVDTLDETIELTRAHTGMTLCLAISYGGRQEITDAVRAIAREVKAGTLLPEAVDEDAIRRHFYQPTLPDPDLLIRTAGEQRISNFLLWQVSYAEIHVSNVCWPDFGKEQLHEAIRDYGRRVRKFGKVHP